MKSISTSNFKPFCFTIYFFISLISISYLHAQPFKLFAVSDLVRVFEDGYKNPGMQDTIKLFGIRGEIISGQCVVQATKSLSNVSLSLSALKNQLTGSSMLSSVFYWDFVGSIPLSKNTPNQPLSVLTRPAPARYPEYLMAEKQISIMEKTFQSIWLTIKIPEKAEAGSYTGKLTVQSGQGEQSIPAFITVYPLTMPAKRHIDVAEWYNTGNFAKVHGIQEKYSEAWFAMLRKYAENMVEHRQNVFQVPANTIEIRKAKSGELEFDFLRFDQIAEVFWSTGKMDYLETGELAKFGEKGWSSSEIIIRDFPVKNLETGEQITMPGQEVIPWFLPALERHLREKGWLKKTLFHIKDEPSMHNSVAWCEMSRYLHHYAPDLVRIDAIETTNLLDDIEIAIPKLDAFATWYDAYRNAEKKGTGLWFYTVGIYQGSIFPNKTIDMPLIDCRIMHWLNYKYDATGYLHWGWNQWTENPYQEVGMHIGDGWHVYPAKDGVLNSLRWEQMRNGLQDYEYFWMLEDRVSALRDSLGSRFAWIDPKFRGKEIAGKVVLNFMEHTDDPKVLYQAKMELINELLEFTSSPRIYVQTNPVVNSTITNHSSIEVYGWTEPGTKIVINGREIPVSKQGLFLEQFGGEAIDKTKISNMQGHITIEASNTKGSKKILRDFVVK